MKTTPAIVAGLLTCLAALPSHAAERVEKWPVWQQQRVALEQRFVRDEFRIFYTLAGPDALPEGDRTDSDRDGVPEKSPVWPQVFRTFMPEAGLSTFAVVLTPELALCYDTLRGGVNQAWRGTIDLAPAFQAKIDEPTAIRGVVFDDQQLASILTYIRRDAGRTSGRSTAPIQPRRVEGCLDASGAFEDSLTRLNSWFAHLSLLLPIRAQPDAAAH